MKGVKYVIKKFKKIIASTIVTGTMMTSIASITVNAEQTNGVNATLFYDEWEFTCQVFNSSGTHIGDFCYGYDMDFINEDYTWTWSSVYTCKAGVRRNGYDSGYNWGASKSGGVWSKIEVTHRTNDVSYCMNFPDNYVGAILGSSSGSLNKI